jgi:hypothetical protein
MKNKDKATIKKIKAIAVWAVVDKSTFKKLKKGVKVIELSTKGLFTSSLLFPVKEQ